MLTSRTRVWPSFRNLKPCTAQRFGTMMRRDSALGSAAAAERAVPPFVRIAIWPWLLLGLGLLAANHRVAWTCCSHCLMDSLDDLLVAKYARAQANAGADRHPRFGKGRSEKGTEEMGRCCCEEALPRDPKVECASSLAAQTRFEWVQHDVSGYSVEMHRQSVWVPLRPAFVPVAAPDAVVENFAEVLLAGRGSCAP